MNKTDRIERIRRDIDQQISYCHNRIDILNKRRNKLIGISKNSFDPHALIPIRYDDIEEWIIGHPFPKTCIDMVYQNKEIAFNNSLVCNTYQIDYHIVKCKPREYYIDKYLKQ